MVKTGDIVTIIMMQNEWHYDGRIGNVEYIDGLNQLHSTWGDLAINLDVDYVEFIRY